MSENDSCPSCGVKLKSTGFNTNILLNSRELSLIKEFGGTENEFRCQKCGTGYLTRAKENLESQKNNIKSQLEKLIKAILIVSTHSPINWDYEIIGMVTGQTTTGTGVLAEFSSSFTDFFGSQSGTYNTKIKKGENLCFDQLRVQALQMGGNAIIATDIDYSEVGGDKGMLMVCMAGTAVRLKNTSIIGDERSKSLEAVLELNARLNYLKSR